MPFTISHAGFLLPWKGLLPTHILLGLMIGSIVPDFGYFIREFGVASFAHTVPGAVSVSLPVGLAAFLLVRLSFKKMAKALPKPHSGCFMSWDLGKPLRRQSLPGIILAIFVGSISHIFADSFTHESGIAVAWFPWLRSEAFILGEEPFHTFRILQYAGSAIGMVMILSAYRIGVIRYCRASGIKLWQDSRSWLNLSGLTAATILAAALMNAQSLPRPPDLHAFRIFGFKFLITWIPVFGVAFLCFAFLPEDCRRRRRIRGLRSGKHS